MSLCRLNYGQKVAGSVLLSAPPPNLYLLDLLINPSSFLTAAWQAAKLHNSSLTLVSSPVCR